MKEIRLIFVLLLILSVKAFASDEGKWQLVCVDKNEMCRSLWASVKIKNTEEGNVLVAYNAQIFPKDPAVVSFVVNINGVKLKENPENILIFTDKAKALELPIAAKDANGVMAEFTNRTTVNRIVSDLTHNEALYIRFIEEGKTDPTTVRVPLKGFEANLDNIPHGDILFIH